MLDLERQQEILDILLQKKSVRVAELAKKLFVSQPTVRRDLETLERAGALVRTHGGAVLCQASDKEIPLALREEQNNLSKKIIAERAAAYLFDGAVIFLDASSTVSYLVPHLERIKEAIVITNSPKTSMRLGEAGVKNYCTGGLLLGHSVAYVGSDAERFVSGINADLFFFSSRGYVEGDVITDSSFEEASIRRAMMKQSKTSVYLADGSKRGGRYAYNICTVRDVAAMIDER